jgi:VanZ family protein
VAWLKQWWPALAWAVVISTFSTGLFTSENTSRIIIPILHWLLPHAPMSVLQQIHHYIRKCAHFTEYFILSLLILRGLRKGRRDARLAWALAAIGIVAAYASLDEFHQRFVPGRTAAVGDVLIDTSGGIAAQLIAALVMLWGHVRHKQRQDAEAIEVDSLK